ncbi:hypothetical protein DMTZ50_0315 [Dehalococcoides mccartyi]|uniref:DUF3644 domain-containing protein n=1 Tax=Dehalococcoides mccartyi TaxID=61435 RepID=UPI00006B065D|nr:DUF3644 domain-containing protein [Dehalococcoides mccartyi]MBA2084510.1 hypothetical protein [Dehalococcoides mccartyi]
MKGLPLNVKDSLTKANESALAAVSLYNHPGIPFRSGGYIVLMIIAWTSLFHAIFFKDNKKPFYMDTKKSHGKYIRYQKIDGENKAWELTTCLKEYYGNENPSERDNLRFFLGLRNKIEHRSMPEIDEQIFGECQAMLFNYESTVAKNFGYKYAINESLSMSLQFSAAYNSQKKEALRKLHSKTYKNIIDYMNDFRSSLSSNSLESMDYSYKVFLIPKTANHSNTADFVSEFINPNKLTNEARAKLKEVLILFKDRNSGDINQNNYRASFIKENVQRKLGQKFSMKDFVTCYKHFKIRPNYGAEIKEPIISKYCAYDLAHGDYVYKPALVEFLVSELSDEKKYENILGRKPIPISSNIL